MIPDFVVELAKRVLLVKPATPEDLAEANPSLLYDCWCSSDATDNTEITVCDYHSDIWRYE